MKSASRHSAARTHELRARIAAEAARLISESGLRDYAAAKRKAATQLGLSPDGALPTNPEVESALREHQRLFHADEQPRQLRRLRELALEAMRALADFEPRLVGAVLDGTADRHSAICLHVFSDDPDAPLRWLEEHGIRCETLSRRLRTTPISQDEFPALRFTLEQTTFDLTVFAHDALRQAPLDRGEGKAIARATRRALMKLLDESRERK